MVDKISCSEQALILHGRAEGGAASVNASSNNKKPLEKKRHFFLFCFGFWVFFLFVLFLSGKEKRRWNQSNLPEQGFSNDFYCSGIVNI